MNVGKLVFAQIMEHLPRTTFGRCVARYGGEHKVKTFSCLDQYLCMAFAQLAVSVYVLVAIVKKRLNLPASLYQILQILSLTMFERMPLNQLLSKMNGDIGAEDAANQLNLFD